MVYLGVNGLDSCHESDGSDLAELNTSRWLSQYHGSWPKSSVPCTLGTQGVDSMSHPLMATDIYHPLLYHTAVFMSPSYKTDIPDWRKRAGAATRGTQSFGAESLMFKGPCSAAHQAFRKAQLLRWTPVWCCQWTMMVPQAAYPVVYPKLASSRWLHYLIL